MQFLRNGSTKLQGFVYHFVGNFKLLHENVKKIVTAVQSDHGVIVCIHVNRTKGLMY